MHMEGATPVYTHAELEQILRNLGHDPTCGACMAVALTGVGLPNDGHTCTATLKDAAELERSCDCCESCIGYYDDTGLEPGWLCDGCYLDWCNQP